MKEIANSKKFWMSIVGVAVGAVGYYLDLPSDEITTLVAPFLVYVGAQGLADFGKAAKK